MTSPGLSPVPLRHDAFWPIAATAVLFWLFSYVLFTSRVQLGGDEAAELFTARRLLTTAAGAVIYAGVLCLIFPAGRRPAHPLVLIAAVIPAAATMVMIRTALDPLVSSDPLTLADHVRWVSVWAGYFGLWLIGFQSWRMYGGRAHGAAAPAAPGEARSSPAWSSAEQSGAAPSRETLEDLIEAIAGHAVRLPEHDQRALLERLGATYDEADDPLGTANTRNAVVDRIARRIAA